MLYLWNQKMGETSKPHVLILNLTDGIDLRKDRKTLLYQILVFIIYGKK